MIKKVLLAGLLGGTLFVGGRAMGAEPAKDETPAKGEKNPAKPELDEAQQVGWKGGKRKWPKLAKHACEIGVGAAQDGASGLAAGALALGALVIVNRKRR